MSNDKSELLTSLEMAEKRKAKGNRYLYFDDGERKIDYVLAYQNLPDDDENKPKIEGYRQTFLANLKGKGVEVEAADKKKSTAVSFKLFFKKPMCLSSREYYIPAVEGDEESNCKRVSRNIGTIAMMKEHIV